MPKFLIKAPRFINGRYIAASAANPATIELPERTKLDKDLFPLDSPAATAELTPHFVPKKGQSRLEQLTGKEPAAEPAEGGEGGEGGEASAAAPATPKPAKVPKPPKAPKAPKDPAAAPSTRPSDKDVA